jgi:hypothetical protein
MGLFCLSMKETPEDQLECALANLDMFRDHLNLGEDFRDQYGNRIPLYLLDFVETQIKESLEMIKSSVDRA